MKIDRLMGIVIYLLNHGRTSAQSLSEEFEVSPRTIVRDLEALDRAGIPIQSFYGVEGGYQIMDSYVFEKQAATASDFDWIVTALKGLASAYANKSLQQTLEKINSLQLKENNTVSLDLGAANEDGKINEQLKLLEGAIEKKCIVQFSYTNSHGEGKEIQAEPVCLQYKWYNWYLIGYYEKYQDYCMFKLVRMDNLRATEIRNTKDHNPSDIQMKDNKDNMVHIKLYGKANIKAKCREYLNGRVTQEFENGDFEFCFSVPEQETFWYGVVLSFGNKAKLLEPQEMRERIVRTCKEIQMEYEESTEE
jgi:predicted DNA-binding transcriptional regulator YafY